MDGDYVLNLVVNDGTVNSAADTVTITAATSIATRHLSDTGQTTCYDASGTVISCAGTGQDGEFLINPPGYTDNGDGTVTDNVTGLMWQQEDDNQTYNWYEATGTADATYNPSGATDVCGDLSLGGHTDWRLPTPKELESITNNGTYSPAIDTTAFPNTNASFYWSSSTYANYPSYAWHVSFYVGHVYYYYKYKAGSHYVRCVR